MILNNFKKVLYLTSRGGNTGCTREEPVSPVSISGGTSSSNLMYLSSDFCSCMRYLPSSLDTSNNGDFCIALGTDDTPVTADDCKWEHGIDNLTNSGYSHKIVSNNGNWVCRYTRTVTNDTAEDITVKEVALIMVIAGIKVMIAREVLDQPVTIKPGGIQAFGIDIG